MIDPMTAMAIANGAIAVGERISDGVGRKRAKNALANLRDPFYTEKIPDGIIDAVGRTKTLASSYNMAGQGNLEAAQDNILAGNVYDINNLSSSSSEGLQALLGAYGNRVKAQNQIGFQSAQDFNNRQGDVIDQQNVLGGYQKDERDKAFSVNVEQPFTRHYSNIMSTLAGYQNAIKEDNQNIKGGILAGVGAVAANGQKKNGDITSANVGASGGASGGSMLPASIMENLGMGDFIDPSMLAAIA